MFMNLHTLPTGKHMFTVAVTTDPLDTPRIHRWYDEVDVVAPQGSSSLEVIAAAKEQGLLADYPDARIVGVVDQSDGYVLRENWDGIE